MAQEVSDDTMAQEVSYDTFFSIVNYYNSNENMDKSDQLETFAVIYRPALALDYSNNLLYLQSRITFDIWRHFNEKDLDREEQVYSLYGMSKLFERSELSGEFHFKDVTVEDSTEYALQGGPININKKKSQLSQKSCDTRLAFDYHLSQLTDVLFAYEYSQVNWDNPVGEDYDEHRIILSYDYRLKNQLDVFTINQNYSIRDSQTTKYDHYEIELGWLHHTSETYLFNASFGGKYQKIAYKEKNGTQTNIDPIAEITLTKKDAIFFWTFGYEHRFETSVDGETYKLNRIYWAPTLKVGTSLSIYCLFDYIRPNHIGGFDPDSNASDWSLKSQYFAVEPAITYFINNNWDLRLEGNYTIYNEAERERLKGWITLRYKLPL